MSEDEGATPPQAKGRFAALPAVVDLDDMVEETDASTPPDQPTSDPNRDVANRWG